LPERIDVRIGGGTVIDLKQCSDVVADLRDFKPTRVHFDRDCPGIGREIGDIIEREAGKCQG